MNLVLLFQEDFISGNQVSISGRRLQHIQTVHKASVGDQLTVGLLNQQIGKGTIQSIASDVLTMDIDLLQPPPPALPLTLILALPRPKMLKRIFQTCATMGVKKIILLNSYRVEKSFWSTPVLEEEAIKEQFILGLEQGKDTVLPEVILEKRFKPFVEDTLPGLCKETMALVAHPGSCNPCPEHVKQNTTLVIGPEGGFIPYEIEKLIDAGCAAVHLKERILKVETAIPVILSKLFY